MEELERTSLSSIEKRKAMPSLWKTGKSSAYSHYKKLVQDFDALDQELQQNQTSQQQIQSQLSQAQSEARAIEEQERDQELSQWQRDRELRLTTIVQQANGLARIHSRQRELEALELRLEAEVQVLQEKQQHECQTEARQLQELVHGKTHLLGKELAKCQLDMEFITQMVTTSRRQTVQRKKKNEALATAREQGGSIHAMVSEIQQRRRREFTAAAAEFQERLKSFEREKDALGRQAEQIRERRQRALQILTSNQQQAITSFFTTPPPVISPLEPTSETTTDSDPPRQNVELLDFDAILKSISVSGNEVGVFQHAENEKQSARRQLEDALNQAHETLATGPERVAAVEKIIADRKRDAERQFALLNWRDQSDDGALGAESFKAEQAPLVYFVRCLVFDWLDAAVRIALAQPSKELLVLQIRQWEATSLCISLEREHEIKTRFAKQLLTEYTEEIIRETALDIRKELVWSSQQVRNTVTNVFRNVFFKSPESAASGVTPAATSSRDGRMDRFDMFASSFEYMKIRRTEQAKQEFDTTHEGGYYLHAVKPLQGQSHRRLSIDADILNTGLDISHQKKRFGGFFSSQKVPQQPKDITKISESAQVQANHFQASQLFTAIASATSSTTDAAASKTAMWEKSVWENMDSESLTVVILSSFAPCACVQFSSDCQMLAVGTIDGEILLWDLFLKPPMLIRTATSAAKAPRSAVSRLEFTLNGLQILALYKLSVVRVWAVNPKGQQSIHSSDCFPTDIQKVKPRALELLVELTSDVLSRPQYAAHLQTLPAVARAKSFGPAQVSAACFFSSWGLFGDSGSVICGASNGDLLKYNFAKASLGSQVSAASFDAPFPSEIKTPGSSDQIQREFFQGHPRAIVLFTTCFYRSGNSNLQVVSVDKDANVLCWEYSADRFTGFGYFTPTERRRLDLAMDQQSGEILQIAMTPQVNRLVFMVFYEAKSKKSSGNAHFLQLCLDKMELRDVPLQVQLVGRTPPRFAISTIKSTKRSSDKRHGCFLHLLMNDSVQIYSLQSGLALGSTWMLQKDASHVALGFSSLGCSSSVKNSIHLVVGGDQHRTLLLKRLTPQASADR